MRTARACRSDRTRQTEAIDCNADLVLDDADLRTGTDCFGYRDTDGDPFEGDYDRDGRVETEASGGSLNIDWDVGDVTITSITAYQKVERLQSEDTEASPAPLIQPTFGAETDDFHAGAARGRRHRRVPAGWSAASTSTTTSMVTTCST